MATEGADSPGRRVLFLAYLFPPLGGGSANRNAGLVGYLPELGYTPRVITGPLGAEEYWAPEDQSLTAKLSDEVEIVRIPGPEPLASGGLRRRVERLLDRDGAWYRWWLAGAYEVARGHAAGVDLIYASAEPYETTFVASRLSGELGIPWVADLLDPWALDEMRMHVSGFHRRRDLAKMRRGLAGASAIVMSVQEARRRVEVEFPSLSPVLTEPIGVGFDGDDFGRPFEAARDSTFKIVHTGFLHTEAGLRHRKTARLRRLLRGEYLPADLLTRSHVFLLEAVQRLLEEDPALADVIEVQLAGAPTDADRAVAERSPVARLLGFVPHSQTIGLIRSAELLFLPMHDVTPPHKAGLIPGKTYEYLASGRPILAAVPAGDARDLLEAAGNAHVCAPTDVEGMARAIRTELDRWRAGVAPKPPVAAVVDRFERRAIAGQLAAVFDRVLDGNRSII